LAKTKVKKGGKNPLFLWNSLPFEGLVSVETPLEAVTPVETGVHNLLLSWKEKGLVSPALILSVASISCLINL
jgi:hypothetical protein